MGNSGSVHHMSSGLKELDNYYQSNDNDGTTNGVDDFCDKSNPLMLPIPSNRLRDFSSLANAKILGANSGHQIKVLPNLSENLRLRSTKNGAILNSGGTISGRKESLLSNPTATVLMERSETLNAENSKHFMSGNLSSARIMAMMQRRSQTQLEMDIRKGNSNRIVDDNVNFKRFSSNLDLRRPYTTNENKDTNSNETFQKFSKSKLKIKKRKAPPVPVLSSEIPAVVNDQRNDSERKQRIFTTKIEATANSSRQQVIKNKQGDDEISAVVMRRNLNPGFRREKSFDAQFLSSEISRNNTSKNFQKEQKPFADDFSTKRKCLPIAKTTDSLLPPIVVNKMEKNDFKMELEVATKSRFRSITNPSKPTGHQRGPSEEQKQNAKIICRSNKPEIQSKIPQLKKTFYFGMESSKRKQPTEIRTIPNFSNRNVERFDETKNYSLKDCDEVYLLNLKYDSEMKQDNGIQLNVRPTLPRRQLEIPRFNPMSAWRTLSDGHEHRKQQHLNSATTSTSPTPTPTPTSLNFDVETANTFLFEDRIHRTYRDPCPFYADNKSGDSGISGDDGYIVEKPIQPQNLENIQNVFSHELTNFDSSYPVDEFGVTPTKVVGPFLTPWTPQQDLEDDEDSSSDGGLVDMTNSHTPTSPHVFSLSLPREHQLTVYREKNEMDFRSLQKLKRTTSSELDVINSGCKQLTSDSQNKLSRDDGCSGNNFRSDNWVLGKTIEMAAGTSTLVNNDSKNSVSCMNFSNIIGENGCFDMSVSAQPMSLGSLATGKHVMYLPNKSTADEIRRQSIGNLLIKYDNICDESSNCKNIPTRNKRFSFQSSVRQIERRRLAGILSKEADQKERLRKSELDAMKRVEEEFQKKRAHEKASIRQQLRLYSMDDDNFMSLPNLNDYRAEPDGAASSSSELSPVPQTSPNRRKIV